MVQVTIAYIALSVGVLLVVAGILALSADGHEAMLSPHRRRLVVGGIAGMILFLVAAVLWLRESLWLRG